MEKHNWENWVADNEIPDVEVDVKAEQRANFLRSAGLVAAGATGGVLAYLGITHLINAEKAKKGELVPGINDDAEAEETDDSEVTESNEAENEAAEEVKSEPVANLIPVDDKIPEGIREALKAMGIDQVDASILAMLEATYQTAVKAESAAVAEEINQLTSLVDKTKADFQKVVDEITAASAADKKASEAKIKELEAANKKLEAAKADAEAKAKEAAKSEEKKSEEKKSEEKPAEEKTVIVLPEAKPQKEEAEADSVNAEEEEVDETPSILDALERMQKRDQSKGSKKSKSGKKAKKSKK